MTKKNSGAPWGWTDAHRAQRVAIVGATGAVGRELAELLLAARHPRERIDCLARRVGVLELGADGTLPLRPLGDDAAVFAGWQLAFLCTPSEISRDLGPRLAEHGVRTIDLSSAHRMRPEIPLVVPEINAHELARGGRLLANPNCTTAIAALPLAALDRAVGLEEVIAVSFQAASGAGVAGLETLAAETREATGAPSRGPRPASPFAAPLAFNVIPAVAELDANGTSGEEQKVIDELRKILGRPELVVEVTTTRVPVERCHSIALHVRLRAPIAAADARELLRRTPGIVVDDDPHGPRPRECAGSDPVHVGRIRAGTRGTRSLCFFAVGDQIRKGAALNALQIAAALPPER
jgi:aspartate-semialdehyde dehydrogenase